MDARVASVNVSLKKGTRKQSVETIELVEAHGIAGDAHAGPWHRQVSLLAEESIQKIRDRGLPSVRGGDFAENITTLGLTLHILPVGALLKVGPALLEITQIGKECHQHCEIFHAVGDCVMPREGVFARVLRGGKVKSGDAIEVLNPSSAQESPSVRLT